MANLLKNRYFGYLLIFLFTCFAYNANAIDIKGIEEKIKSALNRFHKGSRIKVKVLSSKENFFGRTATLKRLSIKIGDVSLGNIQADFLTIIYDNPKIDLKKLNSNKMKIDSYNKMSIKIGVSKEKMKQSMQKKMRGIGKKSIKTDFKYSPPFVECFYHVPESQLGKDTKAMLIKYIAGSNLEGYMAFKLSAKKNMLYADPKKVIMNHFLLPARLVNKFENVYNPFETIAVAKPFRYKINKVTVQDKYIIFSN